MTNAHYGKALKAQATAEGRLCDAGHGVSFYVSVDKKTGRFHVAVWSTPRRIKAECGWTKTVEAAEAFVAEYVARAAKHAEYQNAHKAQAGEKVVAMREKLQVGTVLSYSWGYEQTNVYFYEVVRRSATGATVWVRRIASKTTETGVMCGETLPCPGEYTDTEEKKRVSAYGVSFDHGSGYPVDPSEPQRCSWYH